MLEAQGQWEPRYARRASAMRASEIRELLKVLGQPHVVSFAGGIPDPMLFPVETASAAYAECLASPASAAQALQYSVSEGYLPLRQWIAEHMARRGVDASPDNVLITSGSQQALEFLGKLLLSAGDTALVTAPTYLGALQAFAAYEPRYDHLWPEQGNRTPAAFSAAARAAGGEVKLAYVVPDFANPTGHTLSLGARRALLALAAELDIPVVEDTAYSALRFEGEALPSLQTLDVERTGTLDASRVILCGTFSKILSPGLRVGWICAAQPIIRRLVLIKQASDLNSSLINQMTIHRMAVESYDSQVARARRHYVRRRDAMLAALERHMPSGASWTKPEGGFFIWVTLPEPIDGAALLRRSLEEAHVAFVPGAAFFADESCRNTIRLSFSLPAEDAIEAGIARLAKLIAQMAG